MTDAEVAESRDRALSWAEVRASRFPSRGAAAAEPSAAQRERRCLAGHSPDQPHHQPRAHRAHASAAALRGPCPRCVRAAPVPLQEVVAQLRIRELQECLEKCSLRKSGRKNELAVRLLDALREARCAFGTASRAAGVGPGLHKERLSPPLLRCWTGRAPCVPSVPHRPRTLAPLRTQAVCRQRDGP